MTKLGYSGYSLSHEVFYLQIGQAVSDSKSFFLIITIINSHKKISQSCSIYDENA